MQEKDPKVNHDEKLKPVPYGQYFINEFSEVFDKDGNRLDYINEKDEPVAYIDWFEGRKEYLVAHLVAVTKFDIKLPPDLLNGVEVLYKDQNPKNIFSSNLYYRFRSPIEVPDKPGLYYIPYYTNYSISKEGDMFNLRLGRYHSWHVTKYRKVKNVTGGYHISRAKRDIGFGTHLPRHRALCLAFHKYDSNPFDLVVNHKNGVPGDDRIDNLEWTTYSKNNQHAYDNGLIPNGMVKVLCKNTIKNTLVKYSSIARAARELGKTESFIHSRLKKNHRRYEDGLIFKLDDDSPWPELEERVVRSPKIKAVMARNIFTGKIYIANTAEELSKTINVDMNTILLSANSEKIVPHRGFNFRFVSGFKNWPNHHEKSLRIYKDNPLDPPFGYELFDTKGKELRFFTSHRQAAEYLGISPVSVRRRARLGLCIDGLILKSFNPLDHLGPPT